MECIQIKKGHKALKEQVSSEWPKAGSLYVLVSMGCCTEVKGGVRRILGSGMAWSDTRFVKITFGGCTHCTPDTDYCKVNRLGEERPNVILAT